MGLKKAGIKKLKAHLSAYVKRAAKGERVLITDRGEVVAELVPHREEEPVTLEERILKMAREGRVTLAQGFPDKIPPLNWEPIPPELRIPRETWQRWHDEDREDKR